PKSIDRGGHAIRLALVGPNGEIGAPDQFILSRFYVGERDEGSKRIVQANEPILTVISPLPDKAYAASQQVTFSFTVANATMRGAVNPTGPKVDVFSAVDDD